MHPTVGAYLRKAIVPIATSGSMSQRKPHAGFFCRRSHETVRKTNMVSEDENKPHCPSGSKACCPVTTAPQQCSVSVLTGLYPIG